MGLDTELLVRFEEGLDPQRIGQSLVPARLVGYGEVSAIFMIQGDETRAYKRMPLFRSRKEARAYETLYHEYCGLLARAGIRLPATATWVVDVPGRPVVLYIAQEAFPAQCFAHRLVAAADGPGAAQITKRVLEEIAKVWAFCEANGPEREIAVDGQLSNWVFRDGAQEPHYVDTSTPFIRESGKHRLDPRLILRAVPLGLRTFMRLLFAGQVLNRYYDPRENLIDLVANLYKEQRPDLIAWLIPVVNERLQHRSQRITEQDVAAYYRLDRLIWTLFLGLRRLDCWVRTRFLGRRYEFILPGKIQR